VCWGHVEPRQHKRGGNRILSERSSSPPSGRSGLDRSMMAHRPQCLADIPASNKSARRPMSDSKFRPCPACGQPKRLYMACEHCGYSFIGSELSRQSSQASNSGRIRQRDELEVLRHGGARSGDGAEPATPGNGKEVLIKSRRPRASFVTGHRPASSPATHQPERVAEERSPQDTRLRCAAPAVDVETPSSDD